MINKNHAGFLIILICFFTNFLFAQQRNLWSRLSESDIRSSDFKKTDDLKKYKPFALELNAFKQDLKDAPKRTEFSGSSGKKIIFPDGNGQMVTYLVQEASVMHPDLEKKYPDNRSYAGVSEKDRYKRIRFSVNELGLHAIVIDINGGMQYIEPAGNNKNHYRVFFRKDIEVKSDFQCLTGNSPQEFKSSLLKVTNDGKLRTYRLALAATGEYSQFHIAAQNAGNGTVQEQKAVVLAAMTTAITEVNAVYENDLAISLQLVANTDELIFLDAANDPYSNNDGSAMLDENQTTCDDVIQPGNYDIGHVFSTGGGGVASLGSVCRDPYKARGVTGLPSPTGDYFYLDYVSHEMGHQFGANHSFNGNEGLCAGSNRNDPTAVEVGSGSTIMSYAGLCETQNVQGSVDPYFHIISIQEIRDYVTTGLGGGCANEIDLVINNNAPLADAGADFTIPRGTPFKLVGSGSDADGDVLSYSWEQTDNEINSVPPSASSTSGALYRSFQPKAGPIRYLPQLTTLITGVVSSTWEVTPDVAREMNFMFSVRDNHPEGGQVVSDNLKVTVTDQAGPFLVSSQNTDGLVWTGNSQETITWDVAGTDANGLNVSQVNILLSTDWGKTFSTPLALNVPNDGSQVITVPDTKSSQCFIMVEAVGNNFFALNSKSFSIGKFNEVCNFYESSDTPLAIPDAHGDGITSVINVAENVTVENIEVHLVKKGDGTPANPDEPGIVHTWLGDLTISLESPQGTVIELIGKACDSQDDIQAIITDSGDVLVCNNTSPGISGIIKPAQALSGFNGENAQGNWILKVIDNALDDVGTLEAWGIEICSSEPVLGVNNYVFDDFSVFPNPSDGRFSIKFHSEETGDVDVFVYDLLGRKVVQKTYRAMSNNFKEELNLDQVVGGIYILRVKRGNKISSHKIRIK